MGHSLTTVSSVVLAALLSCGVVPAAAQAPATSADIQRLQDGVYEAGRDVSAVRDRDAPLADSLQAQLDDLRDEVIYLKVKLRKESNVSRAEYVDLQDRIDRLRSQARPGPLRGANPAPVEARVSATEIPVGTEFDVRLQSRLSSGTAKVEDRFDATTLATYEKSGRALVPAGSVMRGVVNSVTPASRGLDRKGAMTLLFDRFTIDGRTYSVRATVTQALQGQNDNGRIAAGAGVGAVIGGILGGFKGALAGILIGGGGTVAATEGNDVDLPAGTVLRVRMDSPLDIAQEQ
jgi:TolA-binding protein